MGDKTSLNRLAAVATTHCMTGCAIGEIVGLMLSRAAGWGNIASIAIAVVLAFIFGYSLTMIPLLRNGMAFWNASGLALLSDSVSISVMETVDNMVILLIPGAMQAEIGSLLFWGSLVLSFIFAWLATFPVNRWLIARGQGHAKVHAHHH